MSKTPSSGNDAQDESNQNLPGIVMIGTFWLVGWSASQLVHQPNPPQKLNENRQPAKGSHCTHRVTDFNLSGTKKRVKFLPIVLFPRLRRIFHHNLFSHNRLEQNESPLPRANFGFQVKRWLRIVAETKIDPKIDLPFFKNLLQRVQGVCAPLRLSSIFFSCPIRGVTFLTPA